MKIIIERKKLLESVGRVQAIVEKRNIMPILEHVKIDISNNIIAFTTTDLDITVRDKFQLDFSGEVSFTVAVQQLYDITRKLTKSEFIELNLDSIDSGQIEISAGQVKITIPCLNPHEFPSFETLANYKSFTIASCNFRKVLLKTKHAMSSGEMRYYLNGINLKTEGEELVAAATDVHRLAISSVTKPEALEMEDGIIIPRKTVNEMIKMTEQLKDEETIEINLSENRISLEVNNTTLISKLINGKYPNYSSIFSIKPDKRFSIDITELENAVELVSAIAEGKIKIINIELLDNVLTISSDSNKDGKHSSARQEIAVESAFIDERDSNDIIAISFMLNAKYLLDVLTVTVGPRIHFNLSNSTAPIIISDTGDLSSKYILMPMQIDSNKVT
jgi:DNA polymerase-3 subunit beta